MVSIQIAEGGRAINLTAAKLKTAQQGGGSCLWVPESDVALATKDITQNPGRKDLQRGQGRGRKRDRDGGGIMPGFNMKEKEWSRNLWERCRKVFTLHDARITALEQGGGGGGGGGSVTVVDGDPTLAWNTRSTVGSVNNTALHVTMPARPTAQDLGAQVDVGFYIDAQGYLCQRIGSDV